VTKASATTPLVPISTTGMRETTKTTTISRRRKYNQMKIPSPSFPKKSLMGMSSILTHTLLNKINYMVIITSALPQMIPPPLSITTMVPPSLQMLSMMPGNITSSIESNIIRTVTTTTAARMVACTRMGTATFPPPDAQFAEPTGMDVYTAL